MTSKTPIIAGVDFSSASASVIRHAVHAARFTGSSVIAVHVLDTGSLAYRAASGGSHPHTAEIAGQAARRLEELIANQPAGATIRAEIRTGSPAAELRRMVEQHGSSLLVIAANDSVKKRLGTIASRCVRSAPCDVLVLRDWQEGDFKKIVVCTDFSNTSTRALERGVALASTLGASLDIVHVMYPPSLDSWGAVMDHPMDSPDHYGKEARDKVNRCMADFLAPHAGPLASVDHRPVILESDSAAAALTYHFQDSGADLVILGTRGVSRLEGFLIGTNAERILQDASVSVLAVRE